jgi:hypothetical protein
LAIHLLSVGDNLIQFNVDNIRTRHGQTLSQFKIDNETTRHFVSNDTLTVTDELGNVDVVAA